MTILVTVFEIAVALTAVTFIASLCWWAIDVGRTSLAMQAARKRIAKIGITEKTASDEIPEALRRALLTEPSANEDFLVLLASLYILRRELGLRCKWFADQLSGLPPSMLEQLVSNENHIHLDDVRQLLLPDVDAPKLAPQVAQRFEENIQDLRRDLHMIKLLDRHSAVGKSI